MRKSNNISSSANIASEYGSLNSPRKHMASAEYLGDMYIFGGELAFGYTR